MYDGGRFIYWSNGKYNVHLKGTAMRILQMLVLPVILCSCLFTTAYAQAQTHEPSVLFVYDTLDDKSSFFITAFRDALKGMPVTVDEAAVEHPVKKEVAAYDAVVLYSRVMAFDMKSPVRTWVEQQKSFNKKKVFLFVTANRWFQEKHFAKLLDMLKKRDATVVDAVTLATKDMTDEKKKAKVRECVGKVLQ